MPLLEAPGAQWPLDWSKDGKYLLYFDAARAGGLFALPMTGNDRKPIPVADTPFQERVGAFSPDSKWVAYDTDESGRTEIVVQSFPNPSGKWQVSTAGGIQPLWRSDGKLMAAAVRTTGSTLETDKPVAILQINLTATGPLRDKHQYAVARDGRFWFLSLSKARPQRQSRSC